MLPMHRKGVAWPGGGGSYAQEGAYIPANIAGWSESWILKSSFYS